MIATQQRILAALIRRFPEFYSGEELARELAISRAAVAKHCAALRHGGIAIASRTRVGYRLLEIPDRLLPAAIWPHLHPENQWLALHCREEIDSTNQWARREGLAGAPQGAVFVAEKQTAGRGRLDRQWHSPPRLNACFSLLWRPKLEPGQASLLTLAAAVAVAEGVRAELPELPVRIKWPNDLLCGTKKICGILSELTTDPDRIDFAVLGIGLNLNQTKKQFPRELQASATSARIELGHVVDRGRVVAAVLNRLAEVLRLLETNPEQVRGRWKALSATLGEKVRVLAPDGIIEGLAEDISPLGHLLVRGVRGNRQVIAAGDVTHLRHAAPRSILARRRPRIAGA